MNNNVVPNKMKNHPSALMLSCILIAGCANNSVKDAPNELIKVERRVFTQSGDWGGNIEYAYGENGKLRHMTYEFTTFSGYDKSLDDFRPTDCVRKYEVNDAGDLVLTSKVTTDRQTKKKVERSFHEPQVAHWMTLAQARKELQAEQAAVPNP